jgi:hypothetical protein
MEQPSDVVWAMDVSPADWIGPRLGEFGTSVTSVIPGGFETYARVLHPADSFGGGLVRWADVATWSGLPLRSNGQFHSIALPPEAPQHEAPWHGSPRQGSLVEPDAERLVELLRQWTTTPDQCWFCIWDGYGWQTRTDRSEPRVHLPNRDYLLSVGPIEAVASTTLFEERGQTPNLWWPEDKAWCVASEIDFPWTYVGGSADMVAQLTEDKRIEALEIDPEVSTGRTEEWVKHWVDQAVQELWTSGQSMVVTPMGTVEAFLTQPGRFRGGELRMVTTRSHGSGSSWTSVGKGPSEHFRTHVASYLTHSVVGLVE